MISLKYRSDIDGLRAIAVLGVVIFHAFPQNLPGGFSGVDIFFVISGYLISGILYKGHREGGFSFKEFYARRIRRLFPALITMLALSLAYGWVILLPDEFEQMGKHIAAGTLFIQNFVFWGESGYFDTAANLKPMLHLWSLAVEEQFYIIFPLVLIVLWKRPRILVPAMVILLVGSFVLNVVMSYQAAMTDFFLTPYRAWEFLAGSLLAWWHEERVEKLGGVARGQGVLDGKAPARENPPAGFDRAGNTARQGPLSSPEGLGGFSSWPVSDQAGQARCGDCHSPPSLAKLENPLQHDPSEFLHTLLDRGHEEEVPKWREAMSWGGALLLAAGMVLLSKQQGAYPGWRALLPVCGTCLLIEGGRGAWVNRKILSHPGLVWIGLISYPLYLFHWPILSFLHIVKGEKPGDGYLAGAIALSLLLATLTYYLVEKKIRHNASRLTLPILVGAFLLIGIFAYGIERKFIKTAYQIRGESKEIKTAISDGAMLLNMEWITDIKEKKIICKTGGNGKKTLFYGDSYAMQYAPRIKKILEHHTSNERGAVFITEGARIPIEGLDRPHNTVELEDMFEQYLMDNPSVDRVVICGMWQLYFDKNPNSGHTISGEGITTKHGEKMALEALGKMISRLIKNKKEVTLVLSTPSSPSMDPHHFHFREFSGVNTTKTTLYKKENFVREYGDILSKIALAAKSNGASVIDPLDYLCTNGICISADGEGVPIRFDAHHLRPGYVRENVKYLDHTVRP